MAFGTSRINGTALLELALNLKTPAIYDTVYTDGKEQRVLNTTETLAAKEKQRQIKERFKAWIFSDPDRTERLVRTYNDAFNNLRPRLFDGSHLDFPGMSKAVTLNPHQKAAVWRCMTGGNTLLAHCVGAGKTFEMIASAMKMKQAGIIKKPMIACPNHMLEQFSREWLQLYPNAKILVASKEDFTKERRKFLTAKIATGDWDGIIVTHSSFERIGMSPEFQADFLREQIAEYESLLIDKASKGRNIIKTLEKQKAAREERLKSLLAEGKKDDGLVFDELGVDQIFIDEFQAYKNLETPTKMERVAGIQTGGSERAFDLYMKAAYLDGKHAGHGLVGASGTPVSNSMVEMYTLQRYFDPAGLRSRGIEHFDAWAATFGEVVEAMEISPDGATLKPRSRFAKFVNLPELVQMFRAFRNLTTRMEKLGQDMGILERHRGDRITVGNRTMSNADAVEALTARLERLPLQVRETRTVPMGTYRGLAFGVSLHPFGGLDAYLDGQTIRRTELREGAGGRALLNALDRLAAGYPLELERCGQDKAVAEGQLVDYQSRLGTVFRHADYERQLADLRDKLKAALSGKPAEEGEPTVAELDGQIKALRVSNAVDAAPARIGSKPQARAEKPVTARIARPVAEPLPVDDSDDTAGGNVIALPVEKPVEQSRHVEQVTQRRQAVKQMSLFD